MGELRFWVMKDVMLKITVQKENIKYTRVNTNIELNAK